MGYRHHVSSFIGRLALTASALMLLAQPASASTSSSANEQLTLVAFATPNSGIGVFTRTTATTCTDMAGPTSNGGTTFGPLTAVTSWNCNDSFGPTSVAFGANGNGFLYGPGLFTTHDGGRTWTRSVQRAAVLAIDIVGTSVWMLESACSPSSASLRCQLDLRTSSNGGRNWRSLATPSRAIAPREFRAVANGQTFLVRVSSRRAILESAPQGGSRNLGRTSFWITADGGARWSRRVVSCAMPRDLNVMSISIAAGRGASLYAVCATEASAGEELKSVLRSTNGGRSWKVMADCITPSRRSCSSPVLNAGYVGAVVAAPTNSLFISGDRTALLVSRDGGARWQLASPEIGNTGSSTQAPIFFSAQRGVILEPFANYGNTSTLWETADGGVEWTPRIPRVT